MSSNVGLTTPRGSGTSGYVQRNLSALRPRDTGYGAPYPPPRNPGSISLGSDSSSLSSSQRQPDQAILAHDRQRAVEAKVFELRDRLEDEGELDEDEIEKRCDGLRMELLQEEEEAAGGGTGKRSGKGKGKGLKPHQVHELAEAKIQESERLRKALGIGQGREGKAWEGGVAVRTGSTVEARKRGTGRRGDAKDECPK